MNLGGNSALVYFGSKVGEKIAFFFGIFPFSVLAIMH